MTISGCSSVVEHFVANERVAGANPVTRSKFAPSSSGRATDL
jgi:uncharacterized protein YceK